MKRFLWLALAGFVYLICTGCGDTFRPIIIPNPPQFPNPAAAHTVLSINDNGTVVAGTAMVIDVSGDTDVSIANVGLAPVHAVQQSASEVLVANHSVSGALADSVTKLNYRGTVISGTNTITLPANSAPNFVATTESSQAYVLLPNLASVGVLDTNVNTLIATMPVGNLPDAMAETPNGQKLYVANQADNTISGFNTSDRSSRTVTGSFDGPLWVLARSDSQRLYVLNGNGVVSTVDTTSTAGPDNVIDASITVPGAIYMLYDVNLNRLYIPWFNQSAMQGQFTMLDVSQSVPAVITGAPIAIAPVLPSTRAQGDVCSTFNPSAVIPAAVASLPDGSRAYVGSYAEFQVNLNITGAVTANGVTTYNYSLLGTIDLLPGMNITISNVDSTGSPTGTPPSDFDGTFVILSAGGGTFQVANSPTDTYVSGGTGAAANICPQVTVINAVSNTIMSSFALPGVPAYDAFCSKTRFRATMAAGGDSTRAYFASCDGGLVDIIDTATESYFLNLPEPVGTRPPIPPNPQNPPQNPIFLMAGP